MRILRSFLLASVSVAALCGSAQAEDGGDQHILITPCSPTRRIDVVGIIGQPTVFTFPKGEHIYRVQQPGKVDATKDNKIDDASWQGEDAKAVDANHPLGNNVTLWPTDKDGGYTSIITMLSDAPELADRTQIVYPFRLTAMTAEDAVKHPDIKITLNLICSGKAPPSGNNETAVTGKPGATGKAMAVRAVVHVQSAKELADAQERIRTDAFNGADKDCHYRAKGKKQNAITPRCPMDNGEWTLFRFPGLSHKPAIYAVTGEDGKDERLVRQHEQGDFVVVEETDAHFRIRLWPDVLDIINDKYDPVGKDPGTGTISPSVHRDIIPAKEAPQTLPPSSDAPPATGRQQRADAPSTAPDRQR